MRIIKRLANWFGLHPMAGDVIWALILVQPTLGNTLSLFTAEEQENPLGYFPSTAFNHVLMIAWGVSYAAPLIWRRTRPALMCTLLVVPHLVQLAVVPIPMFPNIFVLIAMFAVAAYGSERARRLWLALGVAASLAAAIKWTTGAAVGSQSDGSGPHDVVGIMTFLFVMLAASVTVCWLLGAFTRERFTTVRTLKDRADAIAAERDRFAQLAAEQERSRIAREMHDVVAHSLSVIVVQTDGASYALDQPGDAAAKLELAREALARIASTSREALRETRALVGVLREGEAPEMAPQPLLDEVDELIESTRVSGLDIDYAVDGSPEAHAPLGPARETAAYRIVQESLTNVIKHAGPGAHAWVHLTHSGTGLMISIRDDGNGADADDGHGHGLIGMRERVAPFGGTLAARPRLDGGFEVLAIIPVDEDGPPSDRRTGAEGPGAPAPLSRITDLTRNNS
ncbi:histidine kinase dimerization/phosphoacceptor domain protein [Propionibacterium acidifaciens F0233]|uniref:histidine kinase n=1 Tax=Propionibacterium acidifaciens F0233 TaxID=553198 RepID=U2RM10_9ACTN|nr:histidine kinase [Propionibacterium acidifaciens]AYW77925.1 two-component sensor histidine kinase [Propionibacterium acidifaciens]ERK54583.1 histidine kinase dimerization/phosphoacceptor domain protein [Propionibacterium acidifaciens F0233]